MKNDLNEHASTVQENIQKYTDSTKKDEDLRKASLEYEKKTTKNNSAIS
jgi:hypothetical protein